MSILPLFYRSQQAIKTCQTPHAAKKYFADQSAKLNIKLKRLARKSAFAYKAKSDSLIVLEDVNFDTIKTSMMDFHFDAHSYHIGVFVKKENIN